MSPHWVNILNVTPLSKCDETLTSSFVWHAFNLYKHRMHSRQDYFRYGIHVVLYDIKNRWWKIYAQKFTILPLERQRKSQWNNNVNGKWFSDEIGLICGACNRKYFELSYYIKDLARSFLMKHLSWCVCVWTPILQTEFLHGLLQTVKASQTF